MSIINQDNKAFLSNSFTFMVLSYCDKLRRIAYIPFREGFRWYNGFDCGQDDSGNLLKSFRQDEATVCFAKYLSGNVWRGRDPNFVENGLYRDDDRSDLDEHGIVRKLQLVPSQD